MKIKVRDDGGLFQVQPSSLLEIIQWVKSAHG